MLSLGIGYDYGCRIWSCRIYALYALLKCQNVNNRHANEQIVNSLTIGPYIKVLPRFHKCCSLNVLFIKTYLKAAQLFSTSSIIDVSSAVNQHIIMISEDHVTLKTGVMFCITGIHYTLKYIQIKQLF